MSSGRRAGPGPDDLPDDYPTDWTRFSTAQVGALDVPVGGLARGSRAALLAREYLRVKDAHGNDEHGNVTGFEERLGESSSHGAGEGDAIDERPEPN